MYFSVTDLNLNVKTGWWHLLRLYKKKIRENRKQSSHCKDKYLSRLLVPRSVLKRQKESEPSCFWDSPQTWRGTNCRKQKKEEKKSDNKITCLQWHICRWASAPSLVVGHGPAGQDHQGEGGEGQVVNGLAGQSEARPLGYLSQEVGPGHILKHSACGWKKSSTLVNKQIRLK